MRTGFLTLLIFFPAAATVWAIWFGLALKRFVDAHPRIETWRDFEDYKRAVSHQMYAALLQFGFLLAPWGVFGIGLYQGALTSGDFLYILVPSVVLVGVGFRFKWVESRAKSLDVAEEFREEYARINGVWESKPFPDW